MKNVRAVFVNQDAGVIKAIVGIARDVRAAIDQQHMFARAAREAFGEHAPGVTGADDEIIKGRSQCGMGVAVSVPIAIGVAVSVVTVSISILHAMASLVCFFANALAM